MLLHKLKTDEESFNAVCCGDKTQEIRLNDRFFEEGDLLLLIPNDIFNRTKILACITHIQKDYGIKEGYVILSIKVIDCV